MSMRATFPFIVLLFSLMQFYSEANNFNWYCVIFGYEMHMFWPLMVSIRFVCFAAVETHTAHVTQTLTREKKIDKICKSFRKVRKRSLVCRQRHEPAPGLCERVKFVKWNLCSAQWAGCRESIKMHVSDDNKQSSKQKNIVFILIFWPNIIFNARKSKSIITKNNEPKVYPGLCAVMRTMNGRHTTRTEANHKIINGKCERMCLSRTTISSDISTMAVNESKK